LITNDVVHHTIRGHKLVSTNQIEELDNQSLKTLTTIVSDHQIFCASHQKFLYPVKFFSYKIKDLGDEQIYDLLHNGFMVDEYKHILKQELNYRNDNK
jgi:hypothetical protein